MKAKAQIGTGDVELELDGETVTLKPTFRACSAITKMSDRKMSGVFNDVANLDMDVMAAVVALGLGLEGKDAKAIPEKVWRTGLVNLVDPLTRYLVIVSNGGRPLDDGGEEDADPQTSA